MPIRFVRYNVPSSDSSSSNSPEFSYYRCVFETSIYAQTYNAHMQSIATALENLNAQRILPFNIKKFLNQQLRSQLVFGHTQRLEVEIAQIDSFVESTLYPLFDSLIEFNPTEIPRIQGVIASLTHKIESETPERARNFALARQEFLTSSAGAQFGYTSFLQATNEFPLTVKIARAKLKCLSMMYNILQYLRADKILRPNVFETAEACQLSLLSAEHRAQVCNGMSAEGIRNSYINQLLAGRIAIQKLHNTDIMPQFDQDSYMTLLHRKVRLSQQEREQTGHVFRQMPYLSVKPHLFSRASERTIQKETQFWEQYTPVSKNPFLQTSASQSASSRRASANLSELETWFTTHIGNWYRETFRPLFTQRYGVPGVTPASQSSIWGFHKASKILALNSELDAQIDALFLEEYSNSVTVLQQYREDVDLCIRRITYPSSNPRAGIIPEDGRYSSDLERLRRIPADSVKEADLKYFQVAEKRVFDERLHAQQDRLSVLKHGLCQLQWKENARAVVNDFARAVNVSAMLLDRNFLTTYSLVRSNEKERLNLCRQFASFTTQFMQMNGESDEEAVVLISAMSRMCHFSLALINDFMQIIESSVAELTFSKREVLALGQTNLRSSLAKIQMQLQELRRLAEPLLILNPTFSQSPRPERTFWILPEMSDRNMENPAALRYGPEARVRRA